MFADSKNNELDFISAKSASMLETNSRKSKIIIWLIMLFILCAVAWASLAKVDEIVRGVGKIIPSKHVQIIQNLEGGIVSEIFVRPGDIVEAGQKLMKIDNKRNESGLGENTVSMNGLKAKAVRLYAESQGISFDESLKKLGYESLPTGLLNNEELLYIKDMQYLNNDGQMINEQINQVVIRNQELTSRISNLKEGLALTKAEIDMTEPLVYSGAASKIDLLKLQKEHNSTQTEIESAGIKIKENNAAAAEYRKKLQEGQINFRSRAQKEYNETVSEIERVSETITGFEDQVSRSEVLSPVKGIVKKIYVNTVGGVIRPGMDIMEVVPMGDVLEVEAKIKPSDIGFIHEGQKALIKFTAFDFSIYGGLDALVTYVSPDTSIEEKEVYYTVKLETSSNEIIKDGRVHKIIPGMVVSADIITGKKTIMDYILKPVLKTKQAAFSER
ncbi:MAG: HlyD family type I secretion periplasmic adaptor subunit [Deferribacterales bacterium]